MDSTNTASTPAIDFAAELESADQRNVYMHSFGSQPAVHAYSTLAAAYAAMLESADPKTEVNDDTDVEFGVWRDEDGDKWFCVKLGHGGAVGANVDLRSIWSWSDWVDDDMIDEIDGSGVVVRNDD